MENRQQLERTARALEQVLAELGNILFPRCVVSLKRSVKAILLPMTRLRGRMAKVSD